MSPIDCKLPKAHADIDDQLLSYWNDAKAPRVYIYWEVVSVAASRRTGKSKEIPL